MSTQTKTIVPIIVILVLAAGGAYALWQQSIPSDPAEETSSPSEAEGSLPEEKHRDSQDTESNTQKPDANESEEDTQETTDVSVVLNNFGQQDNGTVYANATINGTEEGTCEFRFTRNGASVTETAEVERAPTGYYACGVRLDNSKFSPKGVWTARVYIQNTDPTVKSDTMEAEIE